MGGPILFVENRMMTKADMEMLIADDEGERAAKLPFEFLNVAVANPNLGN